MICRTPLFLIIALALLVPACQNEEQHIVNSMGYYERIVGGSMGDVIDATKQAMAEMNMTVTKEEIGPQVSTILGHTNDDDKRVKVTLTWMNVEYIRIGLRIGDGMLEGGDPRAVPLIKRINATLHPRAVPRESVEYPDDFPERLRF